MIKLVLIRHGQRLDNKFIGWTDVELSPKVLKKQLMKVIS